MKNTSEDRKTINASWISRINIAKMAILPKAIFRFNEIVIKILTQFFKDVERASLDFIYKNITKQNPGELKQS